MVQWNDMVKHSNGQAVKLSVLCITRVGYVVHDTLTDHHESFRIMIIMHLSEYQYRVSHETAFKGYDVTSSAFHVSNFVVIKFVNKVYDDKLACPGVCLPASMPALMYECLTVWQEWVSWVSIFYWLGVHGG